MTYVFQVSPKQLDRQHAYFSGLIWVDDRDLAIVKSYGKWVSETGDMKPADLPFTMFETYSQPVSNKYWMPAYARSDGFAVQIKEGGVPVRLIIRWDDYKPVAKPAAAPDIIAQAPLPCLTSGDKAIAGRAVIVEINAFGFALRRRFGHRRMPDMPMTATPARCAISTSSRVSPMYTQAAGSRPMRRKAICSCAGCGFRRGHLRLQKHGQQKKSYKEKDRSCARTRHPLPLVTKPSRYRRASCRTTRSAPGCSAGRSSP